MNPFFFGPRQRRLFGLYTPGQPHGFGERSAVLCHPFGQEYLRAHRSMRQLATLLTRVGVHVLRFDYFGTGDSAGDLRDAELSGWESDIEAAIEELEETTGSKRVGLVGLRLGATLAAAVAARRTDVERLLLWDPVVRGREYAHELLRSSPGGEAPRGDGAREVLGFTVPARLLGEIGEVDLVPLVPALPQRTLAIATEHGPSHGALAAALEGRGQGAPRLERLVSSPPWVEHRSTGVGAIPVNVLQRIAEWWES